MNLKIKGFGHYLPERILTNQDLEQMVDTSDEWITKRVGIKTRHIAREDEFCADMGLAAAKEALADAGMGPEELDLILCSTVSSEMHTPSVACVIQKMLGASQAAAIDINTACSGFVTALEIANQFVRTGTYRNILVVGTDTMSKLTDWTDRSSCVLFGDGAGAVVVTASETEGGVLATELGADGVGGDNLSIPCLKFSEEDLARRGGERKHTFWMDGSEVFKFAVRIMAASSQRVVEKAGLQMDDIKMVIPHQANTRIIDGAAKRLGLGKDRVFTNVDKTGNMSSACIPVALYEAHKQGLVQAGDKIILVGFGGGLTWAAMLLEL